MRQVSVDLRCTWTMSGMCSSGDDYVVIKSGGNVLMTPSVGDNVDFRSSFRWNI